MRTDNALVFACAMAMRKLNAVPLLTATIRRLSAQHSTSERETEVAMAVLIAGMLDAVLANDPDAAETLNVALAEFDSHWQVVGLDR